MASEGTVSNLDKFSADKAKGSNLDKFLADPTRRQTWYLLPKGDGVGKVTFAAAEAVFNRQRGRIQRLYENALLYGGIQPDAFSALGSSLSVQRQRYVGRSTDRQLRLNMCRRTTDALVAQVTRADVRPKHLSKGGNWKLQRKSKRLDRYSDGQIRKHQLRTLMPNVFRDACVGDMGAVKVYSEDDEPKAITVNGADLAWDFRDARYGDPRQMFQTRWVDREELVARFPECEQSLRWSDEESADDPSTDASLINQLQVIEAWVLPRFGQPGRHIICVRNATLRDEPWERDHFPFAICRFSQPVGGGWFSEGVVEQLRGLQASINVTLRSMSQSLHLGAVPRAFIPRGSRIIPSHITNQEMSLIEFDGAGGAPIFHPGVAFPPALPEHLEMLKQECFDQVGVSRSLAGSQKSKNVVSGIGMKTERDLGSERHNLPAKEYEKCWLAVDELLIDEARELMKLKKKVIVLVPGKRYSEELTFEDVNIERDQYDLGVFATSAIADSPAGLLDTTTDMVQAGMLTSDEGRRLIQDPDLEATTDLDNAPLENILNEVERLLDGEDYRAPEPFQDLALGCKVMQQAWLKARDDGAPEDVLENVRLWVDDATALLKQLAPPAPSSGGAPPLGVPAAPPVSSLLPTAPAAAA